MRILPSFVFWLTVLSLGALTLQATNSPIASAGTSSEGPGGTPSSKASADRTISPGSATLSTSKSFLSRRVRFQALDGALRYLYADSAPPKVTSRSAQYKISAGFEINLDDRGNSYFQARTETGTAYTLIGLNRASDRINAKTFLYGQRFAHHWEAQIWPRDNVNTT
jgi:hypothetical protein